MTNGKDEFMEALAKAERDADWLERSLPGIADEIRAMVKFIKTTDKNIRSFIKCFREMNKTQKILYKTFVLVQTWLTKEQKIFLYKYIKELENDSSGTGK